MHLLVHSLTYWTAVLGQHVNINTFALCSVTSSLGFSVGQTLISVTQPQNQLTHV